jgi:hypothetical protein
VVLGDISLEVVQAQRIYGCRKGYSKLEVQRLQTLKADTNFDANAGEY